MKNRILIFSMMCLASLNAFANNSCPATLRVYDSIAMPRGTMNFSGNAVALLESKGYNVVLTTSNAVVEGQYFLYTKVNCHMPNPYAPLYTSCTTFMSIYNDNAQQVAKSMKTSTAIGYYTANLLEPIADLPNCDQLN